MGCVGVGILCWAVVAFASVQESRRTCVYPEHALPISIEFGPDGDSWFSGRPDGLVHRWSLSTGQVVQVFGAIDRRLDCFAVRPGAAEVAIGRPDGGVEIWRVSEAAPAQALRAGEQGIVGLCWSPDGRRLATQSRERTVRLWDPENSRLIGEYSPEDWACDGGSMQFSPDSSMLLFSAWDGTVVHVCDTRTESACLTLGGHFGGITGMVIDPSSRWLAASTWRDAPGGGRCHVSSLVTGRRLASFGNESLMDPTNTDPIMSEWFSEDASTLYTVDLFGSFEARRTTDMSLISSANLGGGSWPYSSRGDGDPAHGLLAFAPQGGRIFSVPSGRPLGVLDADKGARIDGTADGRFLVTTLDHILRIYSATRLDLLLTCVEYEGGEWLSVTPDLHYIGSPRAEEWARGLVGDRPSRTTLDPSSRSSAAVRRALLTSDRR